MTNDPLFDCSSQTVAITGASGQLGAGYAAAFAERGAKVAILDLQPSALSDGLQQRFPDSVRFISTDVTNRASLTEALADLVAFAGPPHTLINNAAIDSPPSAPTAENGPFESYPEESWDRVLDVNLKGVFLSCQVIGGAMAQNGGGSIVNVASIYGLVSPDQSLYEYRRSRGEDFYKPVAYSASKSGVYNLTRYLAVYWAKKSVRVNSLTIAGVFNHQDREFLEAYSARIPIGRMANAREYDGAVLFLASPAAQYMTGSNLVIDGGWTAI